MDELMTVIEKCKKENAELNHVFDFQVARNAEAEKLWQAATGNHGTLPGLGLLLEWLMGEIKRQRKRGRRLIRLHWDEMSAQATRISKGSNEWKERALKAETEREQLKNILTDLEWQQVKIPQQKQHQFSLLFQRRKRKWALHEMYMWRAAANSINEDCTYNYKQAEKFKARVGELLTILQKHGIAANE